jgi:hypothetical protein
VSFFTAGMPFSLQLRDGRVLATADEVIVGTAPGMPR